MSPKLPFSPPDSLEVAQAAVTMPSHDAITDSGATQIFIMEGTPVKNKRVTTCPLKVALADGHKVVSTHMCDVDIPGLPFPLVGHIIPDLSIASLFGIRVLTDVGCTVTFDIDKCVVNFNGREIMRGYKDPTTDLWTLPIADGTRTPTQHDYVMPMLTCPKLASARACPPVAPPASPQLAAFAHTVRTKANSIKFAHQSFCSPRLSTFLKAIRRGFLKGCPNLSATGVTKYLNPSPASTKGHMKLPHQGIRSTRPRQRIQHPSSPAGPLHDHRSAGVPPDSDSTASSGNYPHSPQAHIIEDDATSAAGNIFCFGAFADKHTGVVYSDLTGTFPYMSLTGNVCFLVVYHYESNAILGVPLKNMEDSTVFNAYRKQFDFLTSKGFTLKLNVMDNQASKQIKRFLTAQECDSCLSNRITTVSMRPNGRYRPSRIISSVPSPQLTVSSPSNYGIGSHHKLRQLST